MLCCCGFEGGSGRSGQLSSYNCRGVGGRELGGVVLGAGVARLGPRIAEAMRERSGVPIPNRYGTRLYSIGFGSDV